MFVKTYVLCSAANKTLVEQSRKQSESGQFNRHFGFMFMENSQQLKANSQKLYHTIAHELAHGVFTLYHTFSTKDKGITQGSTFNLMDYSTKQPNNLLRKYQWYIIHNPRLSLFGGDEEEVSEVNYPNGVYVGLIDRDKTAIKSFELFLSTYYGKKWFLSHARAGDSYKGKYLPIEINANVDGQFFKKNVRSVIQVKDIKGADATTGHFLYQGDLVLIYSMSSSTAIEICRPDNLLANTNKWAHEILYHGDCSEKAYFKAVTDNRIKELDNSRLPFHTEKEGNHRLELEETTFAKQILSILKDSKNIIYSKDYLDEFFINNESDQNNTIWSNIKEQLEDPPFDDELEWVSLYGLPKEKGDIQCLHYLKSF